MKDNPLNDRYYRSIMKSLSRAFQSAVSYYHFELKDFIEKFIQTDVFQYYDTDFTLYCQAPTYQIGKAIDELREKGTVIREMSSIDYELRYYYEEAAYWIGYLLMYWKIKEGITGNDLSELDIDELIFGYEMLHTQSVSYALDVIKKEYMNASKCREPDSDE